MVKTFERLFLFMVALAMGAPATAPAKSAPAHESSVEPVDDTDRLVAKRRKKKKKKKKKKGKEKDVPIGELFDSSAPGGGEEEQIMILCAGIEAMWRGKFNHAVELGEKRLAISIKEGNRFTEWVGIEFLLATAYQKSGAPERNETCMKDALAIGVEGADSVSIAG